MEKLITISDAEAMLILDGLVGKDLFRDISIKLESFLNYPISEEQHELMKKIRCYIYGIFVGNERI